MTAFSNSIYLSLENLSGRGPRDCPRIEGCTCSSIESWVSRGSMQGSRSRLNGLGPLSPFQRKKRFVNPLDNVLKYACKILRCSRDCACVLLLGEDEKGIDSIQIASWRIWPQRFADEDVDPKPSIGCRYSKPPGWMGRSESL